VSFTVIDVPQRSDAWFAARLGRLTGSVAKDMLAEIKSGEAAARRDLRVRLAVERLTGRRDEDGFTNAAMQWGTDHEDDAFAAYEAVTGNMARRTGFCQHDTLMAGASLDGHLGDFQTLVSLKCPKSATHYGYLKAGTMPTTYLPQMTHELWITGAKEYHFLSYDPRFDGKLQTFFVTVQRDESAIAAYEAKALAFLREIDAELDSLRSL
jgi:predicted phage-related endonuclease